MHTQHTNANTHTVGNHYHGNRFCFHHYQKTWMVYKLISQLTTIETMATKYVRFSTRLWTPAEEVGGKFMLAAACLMLGGERKRATGKERKRREERKREVTIGKGGREAKERLGDQNEKWAQIRGAYVHTHRHAHTHTCTHIYRQGPCMHIRMHTQKHTVTLIMPHNSWYLLRTSCL